MPGVRRMVLAHSGRRRKARETGMRAREGWRSRGQRSGPDHKGPRRSGGEPGVAGAFAEARARALYGAGRCHTAPHWTGAAPTSCRAGRWAWMAHRPGGTKAARKRVAN